MGITLKEQAERLFWISNTLSTWRRWTRQFLPPNPDSIKGGIPRELSFNESFELMLAGHLVGELMFSIPDAKRIIEDLKPWMTTNGFYPDCPAFELKGIALKVRFYEIIIGRSPLITDKTYGYKAIGHIDTQGKVEEGVVVCQKTYSEESIGWKYSSQIAGTLHVYSLLVNFLRRMEGLYDRGEIRNFFTAKGCREETESEAIAGLGEQQQDIHSGV